MFFLTLSILFFLLSCEVFYTTLVLVHMHKYIHAHAQVQGPEDTCTHFLQCAGPLGVRETSRELRVDVNVLVEVWVQLYAIDLSLVVEMVTKGEGPRTEQHEGVAQLGHSRLKLR